MQIQPIDHKTFEIRHQKIRRATIHFPSIWKLNAEVKFRGGRTLSVKQPSVWKSIFQAEMQYELRAELKACYGKKMTVNLYENPADKPVTYTIRKESAWDYDYLVGKENGSDFLRVKAKWIWRKFKYAYEVEELDLLEQDFKLEMLTYVVFLHRVQMQQAAAG